MITWVVHFYRDLQYTMEHAPFRGSWAGWDSLLCDRVVHWFMMELSGDLGPASPLSLRCCTIFIAFVFQNPMYHFMVYLLPFLFLYFIIIL